MKTKCVSSSRCFSWKERKLTLFEFECQIGKRMLQSDNYCNQLLITVAINLGNTWKARLVPYQNSIDFIICQYITSTRSCVFYLAYHILHSTH